MPIFKLFIQGERQEHRLRRERLQLREEQLQVLRRLRKDPGEHDPEGARAHAAHPLDDAVPAGRSADCAYDGGEDVSTEPDY